MKQDQNKTTLVLGGTGKTGRRVAEKLTTLGLPIRIGSRSAKPSFDWNDSQTYDAVLQGMHSVYLSFQPDLPVPGAPETIKLFVEKAKSHGVERLILLSGRGEKEAVACEKIVMGSGMDWTVLRASWFNQNFSEGYMLDPILGGIVTLPVGDVGEPFIDVEDIADMAVVALTKEGHSGQLYEITGPRLLTFKEAIAEISEATGRPIKYETIPLQSYVSILEEYEVPKDYISLLTYLFSEVLDGRNADTTDVVERVLGRKAKDFKEYARKSAASGIWD